MESPVIKAEARLEVSIAQARQWFMELETFPERYQFETHAGFTFTQGSFGEIGARFQTREQFYGLKLTLRFELTDVGDRHFRFRLLRPALPVWGTFDLEEAPGDSTNLCLEIGGITRPAACFLQFPLVRDAVQRQIRGEVEHIKASLEATYSR
jgi:hypothetical protein